MVVHQQLPAPPRGFVDREALVGWLTGCFAAAKAEGRPAQAAMHGPSGVGARSVVQKAYWADPARFPDGALRVRLGDAVDRNADPVGEALSGVLVDLGVPRDDIPVSVESRSDWLRSHTYSLSLLLVLEEVVSVAQVKPFLLNSPGSALVVVARSRIRLLAKEGFDLAAVEPLADEHGVAMFERALGPDWFAAADVRPESLVRACGGYPLAISTTAAQIAGTPEWEVPELIREVARSGVGALDRESQDYVRDSFDRAYQRLAAADARAYRLVVGVHPGSTVPVAAAAAMLGESVAETRAALSRLAVSTLVEFVSADLVRFHDVAHWHARERADADEPFEARRAAAERVIRWYLDETVKRDRVLSDRPRTNPAYGRKAIGVQPSRAEALVWLEEYRPNLRAAVALAERIQAHDLTWQLCEALWGLFHLHRHYDDWITTHHAGLAAAIQSGNPSAVMRMTSQLGSALLATNELAGAAQAFADSGAAAEKAKDPVGRQSALEWSGKVAARRGEYETALRYFDQSWHVAETQVPAELRPRMLALLCLQRARVLLAAGRADEVQAAAQPAVEYFEQTNERDNQAKPLLVQAKALAALGRATVAAEVARRVAALFRADESLQGEAEALDLVIENDPTEEERARLLDLYTRLSGGR
ncbi:hypothetical protein [Actinokineospora enzanensis]|uniref:hypothetical protein n=1 Tax=Actinokineospora enzanensis TaxID=155975 RepID=UPI0012EBA68C|nr:hypothetical protein [Actinokineospora enzanensis]